MKTVTRQWRSGFFGIEILLILVVIAAIFGVFSADTKPTTSESPKADTGAAKTITDTARAGAAVLNLSRAAGGDAPAADTPAVDVPPVDPTIDPTTVDPAAGTGALEVIKDVFEGVFGF